MTRIAALNDFSCGSSDEEDAGPTREALEAEAAKNYNRALKLHASQEYKQAYEQFCLVLQNPYIEKACWPEGIEPGGTLPQDLALKYSCLKNLGNLAYKQGEFEKSVEYYLEAVQIDKTEVTVWHRLGASAIKVHDFELALVAFQEGYNVNPNHWPCIDQLLSVLFILRSYMDCLGLAALALQRDPGYIKALAFTEKIFEFQPSLKEDVKFYVKNSEVLFKKVNYDKILGDKFISTCESLRPANKTPRSPVQIPSQKLRKPIEQLTWEDLGKSLMSTYDSLLEDDSSSFSGRIDVYDALNHIKNKDRAIEIEDLGITPLDFGSQDIGKGIERDRNSTESLLGNPIRISGRRRTIELGESQDSFRVSEKRRSLDSDTSRQEDTKSNDGGGVTTPQAEGSRVKSEDNTKTTEEETKGDQAKEEDNYHSEGREAEASDKSKGGDVEGNAGVKDSSETVKAEPDSSGVKDPAKEKTDNVAKVDGDTVPDMPVFEMESDNDFQGFTNASAYKDRHLKLVQGKNSLSTVTDEDEFAIEQSGDEREGSETPKKANISSKVVSEVQDKVPVEETVLKDGDESKNHCSVNVEQEENADQSFTSSHEEDDLHKQEEHSPEKVDSDGHRTLPKEDAVDEGVRMEEEQQCNLEEQENDDGRKVAEESEMVEDDQENANCENEGNEGGSGEEQARDLVTEGNENNERVNEQMGDCDADEGENLATEHGEPGMEGNEREIEENVIEETEGVLEETEGELEGEVYHEVEEGMEEEGMMCAEVTETEAAVNALKGIMALQPTEILGLPEPDFDYDNDYVEYFDGGVYEDEDDDDRFHSMDQGEEEDAQEMTEEYQDHEQMQENADQDVEVDQDGDAEQEEIHRGDSSQEDEGETNYAEQEEEETQQGVENADTQSDQAEKNICEQDQPEESSKDKQTDGKSDNEADKDKNLDARMKGRDFEENNDALSKDNDTNSKRYIDLDESNATTSEANSKSGVSSQGRKSKRTKRGLERELEQLDYWGRRQERDAKRRRRTISSKLLGAIEEAEYLTWADLLRSFVPAALLNANLEDKKKEQKSENSLNPSGVSDTNSQRSTALPDASSQSKKDLSKDNVQETDKNSDSKELTSTKDTQEKTDTEKTGDAEVSPVENKSPPLDKDTQEDATATGKEKMANGVAEETQDKHNGENAANEKDLLKQQREEIILSTTSPEEAQVQAFLLKFESNGGILHLLQQFLKVLMKRHKYVWPISAAKVFMEVYPRVRNHVFHGNPWNPKENSQRLRNESLLALTHWEICCSIYQSSKLNTPISESRSMLNPFSKYEGLLEDDIYRLVWMLGRGDIWQEEAPQFHTRLQWLQSQIRLVRGQPEEAAYYLELLLGDLSHLASEGNKEYCCTRARVESDNVVVCYSEVKRQLNVLQRSHMLEQVVDNYTDGRYRVVADLLTTIFHEPLPKSRPGVTLPTRQTQLAILADSLYKLSEYKDVIYWGSFSLTEALMRYNRAEAEEEKNRWAKTLMKITDTMNTMLINDITILMSVDRERLSEIVGTLIRMLVVQLEKPQSALILPFETLTPWMLLHRILSHEESCQAAEVKKVDTSPRESDGQTTEVKVSDAVNGEKDTEDNENTKKADISSSTTSNPQGTGSVDQKAIEPAESKGTDVATSVRGPLTPYPSTLFLITAHDELGKHSWCCYDDGIFLLYCLDVLLIELRRPLDSQHRVLLHHTLEQVTFCLYSHPSKKSKHKHLRDHGVPQIAFCWERAMQLYQYYRPNVLPDFQTSQIPSITDDAAVLFRRIIALLPDEAKPDDQTQGVEAYINGEVAECNYSPFAPPTDIISDCFYLLGDYYFKNKEWQNAIKYYKLDLSINKERLESWAPLGLSMKAMLETQLNSCEVIEDEEAFFSLAKAAVQCLRQALKLDQYHTNLWVEFGGLVYMVHSHASRLLKQELNPDISLETFDMLEKFKNEMLDLAENCFTRALTIQEDGYEEGLPDERWLHCYMLGKVSEKKGRPPQTIIQYYLKAANYLHNIRAKYPIRINYNSPQEFSVEALEMYYRIHAFILKYLHQREGRDVDPVILDTFTKCLDELETSSFATCREKRNTSGTDAKEDDFLSGDTPSKKRSLEDVSDIEPPAKKHLSDVGNEDKSATKEEMQIADDKQDSKVPVEIKKDPVDKEKKESDDEIQVVEEKVIEKKDHYTIVSRCLAALRMCLSRFQEHYKTMYRLAHYYHVSKFHKDNNKAQNYLLGCHLWQNVGYMPVNGLFNERKVWIQQPKNSNFFHGVWRIPNDEIDRPGSFAAHMYRCVSLILDILPQMKDFFMILQIALALKNSPDKDKKYLRDNERELLSEHATQVGLQTMKDKFKVMFKGPAPVNSNRHLRFLLDVYKCYKQVSKHLPGSEPHFAKMLTDAYAAYKSIKVENRSNVLREADSFCNRHQYLAHRAPINNPANVRNPLSNTGSSGLAPPVARRGRPPLTGRGRGRGRGSVYNTTSRTVGDMLAVQQAYKIYESLISTQTLLNKKDLGQVQVYNYQKQLESYQSQLMKYLQIPCVAHYFQASLQGLGTTSTKLPPPRVNQSGGSSAIPNRGNEMVSNSTISPGKSSSVSVVSSTPPSGTSGSASIAKPDQQRASLSALAARSHAHGISITSVSGTKGPSTQSQPLKPNMSVTVSPVKSSGTPSVKSSGTPTVKGCDISVVSVSQTSPVKTTSASVSPSKTETTKLSLPASTTVKPISPSQGSVSFKPGSSVQVTNPPSSTEGFSTFKAITSLAGGSTTIKPSSSSGTTTLSVVSTSSGGSTTIKTITSGTTVTTTFKPVTSLAGSTTLSKVNPSSSVSAFKSSTSGSTVPKLPAGSTVPKLPAGSTVPKLPAGTTLTRPREISSEKVSVSREHLQASGRPAKSNLESVIPSSSMPSSKPSDSSSLGRTHSGLSSKPSLPKDMTITPAPRVKTQARQAIAPVRPVNSPSTSFFRAFEASLGLNSSKSVPEKSSTYSKSRGGSSIGSRPISQSQTTSVSSAQGRVTQLTPQELLQLAYRSESHGQLSLSHVPNSGGHKQSTSTTSPYSGQYTKTAQQLRAQAKPTSSSTSSPSSTLTGLQSSGHKTTPQQLGTQQQISSQQSSRPAQPSSSVLQVNVANKSRTAQPSSSVSQVNVANKPNTSKKPSDSSDDIITLD